MLETEPQLKDTYVADGQVRLIYKHYPLPNHPLAAKAAEASECASQQNMFWEMKRLLFETDDEWGRASDPADLFENYAADLDLDTAAFRACYDSGQAQQRWQEDVMLGQSAQVSGTPNFFVIRMADHTGTRIPGFVDFAQFQQLLDQLLATPES